jgi:UDP-N-acetylglucosamine--N-acetylmuramyl-(pentapeptide) pyrophosphoryl-undecaprenol N-acetylglucosamine transferase
VGQLFADLRPGLVVATGGYASGPAGIAAVIMGVPLALQEQNARPGFTTRMLSRWARRIHLAFPEARGALPPSARSRARLSGNPIRPPGAVDRQDARARFGLGSEGPVMLVVGGSQGADRLNDAVLDLVGRLVDGTLHRPDGMWILWATGPGHLDRVASRLEEMGEPAWVRALGYIDDMPEALSLASVAVSRAGAMMTAELLAWGVPAVLVPLPTAAADHQTRNAESLVAAGAAVHLPERDLDGSTLWAAALSYLLDPEALENGRRSAMAMGRPDASREIARDLATLLPAPGPGVQGRIQEAAS